MTASTSTGWSRSAPASRGMLLALALWGVPALASGDDVFWHEAPPSPGREAPATCQCPDFALLVARVAPAVVSINVRSLEEPIADSPEVESWLRWYRGRRQDIDIGSGFILSEDGYLVTNAHLVEKAARILVRLADDRELPATVVGLDRRSDLALLAVSGQKLPTVQLGESARLRVGQGVIAIGNPMGLSSSVTAGIVSALDREGVARDLDGGLIQTDASINPGNSGGPLVNLRGEVVGMNTALVRSRLGSETQAQGIGFAIPIDHVKRLLPQLREHGRVRRGYLGLRLGSLDRPLARSLGLEREGGALVLEVLADSPAQQAGVQAGDVILRFGGESVRRSSDLTQLASAAGPGTKVPISLWRGRKGRKVQLVLGSDPAARDEERPAASTREPRPSPASAIGLHVTEIPSALRQQRSLPGGGVLVVAAQPEGLAALAGIRADDLILRAGEHEVQDPGAFAQQIARLAPGEIFNLLILREDRRIFFSLRVE
ncbi:MAG: trypsin-like peptidase domain-containing protein [Myxococcota bacterium]|nr:trypsin-like peptidase domain-containing protein [Myxococcota bacterium]